jgi:hypothetical protein
MNINITINIIAVTVTTITSYSRTVLMITNVLITFMGNNSFYKQTTHGATATLTSQHTAQHHQLTWCHQYLQ